MNLKAFIGLVEIPSLQKLDITLMGKAQGWRGFLNTLSQRPRLKVCLDLPSGLLRKLDPMLSLKDLTLYFPTYTKLEVINKGAYSTPCLYPLAIPMHTHLSCSDAHFYPTRCFRRALCSGGLCSSIVGPLLTITLVLALISSFQGGLWS